MTVRLVSEQGTESTDLAFTREVLGASTSHLERCYQCQACSSGCPFAYIFDYAPHQLLRMVQLGLKDRVMQSKTYWLCASCETCATRCPNDIEIVQVMDTLRHIAFREGYTEQTPLPLFHRTFLGGVKSYGKLFELMLILRYMLTSRDIFKLNELPGNMKMGYNMFSRGKLAVTPDKIKGMANIKRIFQQTEKKNG
jgi:heterodisulfide reductase subunit C